jgi:hypothetical protein
VQQLVEQQLGQYAELLAAIDQEAQQYAPQPQMPPDTSMQVAQLNAQIQQAALQQRSQTDAQRLQIQQQTAAQKAQLDAASLADKQQARAEEMQREQLRQAAENERTAAEISARVSMNDSDNATAMRLAAAEIQTGERIAVSTGTGINPNP